MEIKKKKRNHNKLHVDDTSLDGKVRRIAWDLRAALLNTWNEMWNMKKTWVVKWEWKKKDMHLDCVVKIMERSNRIDTMRKIMVWTHYNTQQFHPIQCWAKGEDNDENGGIVQKIIVVCPIYPAKKEFYTATLCYKLLSYSIQSSLVFYLCNVPVMCLTLSLTIVKSNC